MERKVLPVGIDSFRKLRERGYYYVDKTGFAKRLIRTEKHCFLSRPRHFGKSTFVSMLKELFEGNRRLFEGLAIYDDWDWTTSHPVIRLDFHGVNCSSIKKLERNIIVQIEKAENEYGIEPPDADIDAMGRLSRLIHSLCDKTGKPVVFLVDGYDKPILYILGLPKTARKNLNYMYKFYSILKSHYDEIEFSFFTGVSKLSRKGEFMGPDCLCDITVDPRYSAICGFTESDLDSVFAPELDGMDREKIKEWYKGYSWRGEESVYNPLVILNLLQSRKFRPWWYEADSRELIIKTLRKNRVMPIELDSMDIRNDWRGLLNIDNIALEVLLFQTGYMTIAKTADIAGLTTFNLDYPNREVRQCLNGTLLYTVFPDVSRCHLSNIIPLQDMLSACDVEGLKSLFQSIIPHILYHWNTHKNITRIEAYVANAFYTYFMRANLDVRAVDFTNRGHIDLAVTGPSYVYLFEVRVANKVHKGKVLKQTKDTDYAKKYRGLGKPVYLARVEFESKRHSLVNFEILPDCGSSSGDMQSTAPTVTAGPSL